jgi:hypothetical protein
MWLLWMCFSPHCFVTERETFSPTYYGSDWCSLTDCEPLFSLWLHQDPINLSLIICLDEHRVVICHSPASYKIQAWSFYTLIHLPLQLTVSVIFYGNFHVMTNVVSRRKHFAITIMIVMIIRMNQQHVLQLWNTTINVLLTVLIAKMEPVFSIVGSVMVIWIVRLEMMKRIAQVCLTPVLSSGVRQSKIIKYAKCIRVQSNLIG